MRFFYTSIMVLLTPYFIGRLWWKSRQQPAYRQRIAERFSFKLPVLAELPEIWVHAVSLGEAIAAAPLIEALLAKGRSVIVTTMTPTGSAYVTRQFSNRVLHQYAPYDLPGLWSTFFRHYQPRLGLIMETEIWPNMILSASKCGVPLVLVNGRLSEASFQRYARLRFLFGPLLRKWTALLVQTPEDQLRFLQLGALAVSTQVIGNMKFDISLAPIALGRFEQLRAAWGKTRPVIIVASTHEDEEAQVLSVLRLLQKEIPQLLLVIAPRHPDRFQSVYALCMQQGFHTGRGSEGGSLSPMCEVIVLDSLGELMQAYACADYAFVGGSLISRGGHNLLEPIAAGVPVFSGPSVYNFKFIAETLQAVGALQLVSSAQQLAEEIIALHRNEIARRRQIKNATEVLRKNQGVIEKYLKAIAGIEGANVVRKT